MANIRLLTRKPWFAVVKKVFCSDFLENYLFLSFGIVGGACEDVTQEVFEVEKFDKRNKLMDIISGAGQSRTLIFVETKKNADFLATFISLQGIPTTSIHGDRYTLLF